MEKKAEKNGKKQRKYLILKKFLHFPRKANVYCKIICKKKAIVYCKTICNKKKTENMKKIQIFKIL